MTDKELLEYAAKAAGIEGSWERDTNFMQERWYFNVPYDKHGMLSGFEWNPLRDDSDAFRLAVKLNLDVENSLDRTCTIHRWDKVLDDYVAYEEQHGNDKFAATRRAIVRAAAQIGKEMK